MTTRTTTTGKRKTRRERELERELAACKLEVELAFEALGGRMPGYELSQAIRIAREEPPRVVRCSDGKTRCVDCSEVVDKSHPRTRCVQVWKDRWADRDAYCGPEGYAPEEETPNGSRCGSCGSRLRDKRLHKWEQCATRLRRKLDALREQHEASTAASVQAIAGLSELVQLASEPAP